MVEPNESRVYTTANSELHESYGRYMKLFTAGAILVHALLLVFFVTPRARGSRPGSRSSRSSTSRRR